MIKALANSLIQVINSHHKLKIKKKKESTDGLTKQYLFEKKTHDLQIHNHSF